MDIQLILLLAVIALVIIFILHLQNCGCHRMPNINIEGLDGVDGGRHV
jgi:hypothetical protein